MSKMGLRSSSACYLLPLLLTFAAAASGHQFLVGSDRGWAPPADNTTETYNQWAEHHRFHVGDTLYFNYGDDSLVVVSREGYDRCDASSPIQSFGGGGAVVKLDRHGFFFFISGNQTNCEAGQKIIIRVMVQDTYHPISRAPAAAPGGGDGGWEGAGSGAARSSSAGVVSVGWGLVAAMAAVCSFVQ